jgi:Flp pilus assembly protein TadB
MNARRWRERWNSPQMLGFANAPNNGIPIIAVAVVAAWLVALIGHILWLAIIAAFLTAALVVQIVVMRRRS